MYWELRQFSGNPQTLALPLEQAKRRIPQVGPNPQHPMSKKLGNGGLGNPQKDLGRGHVYIYTYRCTDYFTTVFRPLYHLGIRLAGLKVVAAGQILGSIGLSGTCTRERSPNSPSALGKVLF